MSRVDKVASTSVLAVVGLITVSSGVAGLVWWFYKRLNQATRMEALKDNFYNIEQLYSTIETLRRDIEELKAIKSVKDASQDNETEKSTSGRKTVRFKKTTSVLSSTDTEYQSAWSGAEDSSEEFYDFSETDDLQEDTMVERYVFTNFDNSKYLYE